MQTVENINEEEQAIFKGYEQNVPINQKEISVMSLQSKEGNMTKEERKAKRRSSLQMMGTLYVTFPFPQLAPLVSIHSCKYTVTARLYRKHVAMTNFFAPTRKGPDALGRCSRRMQ